MEPLYTYFISAVENERWGHYVHDQINRWKLILNENVVNNRHHPVIVVHYEQLKSNQLMQVPI